MPTTREELDRFHQFAIDRLATADPTPEIDDLMQAWCDERERGEINAVIRQGLADIDAGLGRQAMEVSEELRARYGFPAG